MAKKKASGVDWLADIKRMQPAYDAAIAREQARTAPKSSSYSANLGTVDVNKILGMYGKGDITKLMNESQKAAESILKKQGRTLSDLDPETQKYIQTAKRADAEAAAMGKPRKEKKSFWEKTLSHLDDPLAILAGARGAGHELAAQQQEKGLIGKGWSALNPAKYDWGQVFDKGTDDFADVLKNKKQFTSSAGIQQMADEGEAIKRGVSIRDIEKEGLTGKGKVKGGNWTKYGVGFVGDVVSDPTSYLGFGLATKAVKGGKATTEAVQQIERSAKAIEGLKKVGLSDADAVKLIGGSHAPVDSLTKKAYNSLSPVGKELADFAKESGVKRVRLGEGSKYLGTPGITAGKTISEDVERIQRMLPEGTSNISDILARNVAPQVKRNFAIRAYVPLAGTKELSLPSRILRNPKANPGEIRSAVDNSLKFYNRNLRARAGISDDMNLIRGRSINTLGQYVRAYAEDVASVINKVPKQAAEGAFRSWQQGHTAGNTVLGGSTVIGKQAGKKETDLVEYFDEGFNDLNEIISAEKITPEELDAITPKSYRVPSIVRETAEKTKSGKPKYKEVTDDPEWFLRYIKSDTNIKDPGKALVNFRTSVYRLQEQRHRQSTIAEMFGHKVSETGSGKAPRGWVKTKTQSDQFKDVYFHPEMAQQVDKIEHLLRSPRQTEGFLREYAKVNTTIKKFLTIYNPGFHVRTSMGEAILSFLGGMPVHAMAPSYNTAYKVLRGRNRELIGPAAASPRTGLPSELAQRGDLTRREILNANVLGNYGGAMEAAAVSGAKRDIKLGKFGNVSSDFINHAYRDSGIKTGMAAHDLVDAGVEVDRALLGQASKKTSATISRGAENVEDLGRMAHFIHLLRTSKAKTIDEAVADAAKTVQKYHLDYSATTKFENDVARYVIPFYKWIRLSAPMILEMAAHNPGRAFAIPKGLSNLSKAAGYDNEQLGFMPAGADVMVPEYMRSHGAFPMFGLGGNTRYFDPTNLFPLAGTLTLGSEAQDKGPLGGKIHPLLNTAINLGTGENPYNSKKKPWADPRFFTGQLPQTRLGTEMVSPSDPDISRIERLLMWLANPGIQSNTPKKIKNESLRTRDAATKNRKARKQELGIK